MDTWFCATLWENFLSFVSERMEQFDGDLADALGGFVLTGLEILVILRVESFKIEQEKYI